MPNQKFYEAVLRDVLPIFFKHAAKGWPPLLYPWFLAKAQMPDADEPAQKAFTLHLGDSIEAGVLPAVYQRIPWAENELIEPHANAQDFAAWLAREGVEPSPLVAEWFKHQGVASPAPAPAPAQAAAPAPVAGSASSTTETKEQRQDRRLQACIDAGLPMLTKSALSRLPDGVGNVADREGVTRQAFSADVKAALKRREHALREGRAVLRA